MALTRTRFIVIGVVVALVGAGIAMALTQGGGGAKKASTPETITGSGDLSATTGEEYNADSTRSSDAAPGVPVLANGATGGASGGDGANGLPSTIDRQIVQSSSIDVGVEEVGRSFQDVIRIATTSSGFVANSSFTVIDDEQVADITVRVPNAQYQEVLGKLRAMGEVTSESSDANDVTEEYTDLQARLRTLQATEQRYLELLAQAQNVNDVLVVQDRLDAVRGEIEQVQGRINLLDHLTDLATITAHLRPLGAAVGVSDGGGGIDPLEAAANAYERSLDTLRGLAAAVLVVGAFSWWLVPPLALAAFAVRRYTHREAPPQPPSHSAA